MRAVARNASRQVQSGYTCDYVGRAVMSAVATTLRTDTPPSISTRRGIRSSKATTHPRDGAGAISTRPCSISPPVPRRSSVQSHATINVADTKSDPLVSAAPAHLEPVRQARWAIRGCIIATQTLGKRMQPNGLCEAQVRLTTGAPEETTIWIGVLLWVFRLRQRQLRVCHVPLSRRPRPRQEISCWCTVFLPTDRAGPK